MIFQKSTVPFACFNLKNNKKQPKLSKTEELENINHLYSWLLKSNSSITIFDFSEPRTEILGDRELFVDYASSLNLTCLVISPNPPAFVFWKLTDKVSFFKTFIFNELF